MTSTTQLTENRNAGNRDHGSTTSLKEHVSQAISNGMLRRPPTNLNKQAENATITLIREVLDQGIELSEVSTSNQLRKGKL